MIRVGFPLYMVDSGWLGGLNYFRNLFSAILALPDRRIEPIVFVGSERARDVLKDFPPVRIIHAGIFGENWRWAGWRWRCNRRLRRDVVLEAILRWHGVSILSHTHTLPSTSIATICWIPDFQDVHLPQFFTADEIAQRKSRNATIAAEADVVLLSSCDAQRDFCSLYPQWADKSRVLPFVADVAEMDGVPDGAALSRIYGLTGPYFLVANQFWAHKNHRLIVDALSILKRRGCAIPVLATGNPHDYRAPGFYAELMRHVRDCGVADFFKPLGVVPQSHLVGLMKQAVAILNPSRFEGWNTSIEEAKTLGVRVIASDIRVHLEQAPPGAVYVHPDRADELADAMTALWAERDRPRHGPERADFVARRNAFARGYEDIVMEVRRSRRQRQTALKTIRERPAE